jgi:chromate transport protein ChrA
MAIALLTLAVVGTAAFGVVVGLGFRLAGDPGFMRAHFLGALGATTLLVMAHSFIMFFLIATGVEMKEMEKANGWGDSFRRRIVTLKSRAFPAMTSALLLVMANFILGAAAHTRAIPYWAHGALGLLTFAVCALALHREYGVLGDNNRLIAEAATRRRSPALVKK